MKKSTGAFDYTLRLIIITMLISSAHGTFAQDNKPYVRIAKFWLTVLNWITIRLL